MFKIQAEYFPTGKTIHSSTMNQILWSAPVIFF